MPKLNWTWTVSQLLKILTCIFCGSKVGSRGKKVIIALSIWFALDPVVVIVFKNAKKNQTRTKDCSFQNSPNNDFFLLTEAFSLFSVVTFPNDECTTVMDTTMRGLCITAEECTDQGGTASGNCASGFGVCCFTT